MQWLDSGPIYPARSRRKNDLSPGRRSRPLICGLLDVKWRGPISRGIVSSCCQFSSSTSNAFCWPASLRETEQNLFRSKSEMADWVLTDLQQLDKLLKYDVWLMQKAASPSSGSLDGVITNPRHGSSLDFYYAQHSKVACTALIMRPNLLLQGDVHLDMATLHSRWSFPPPCVACDSGPNRPVHLEIVRVPVHLVPDTTRSRKHQAAEGKLS